MPKHANLKPALIRLLGIFLLLLHNVFLFNPKTMLEESNKKSELATRKHAREHDRN